MIGGKTPRQRVWEAVRKCRDNFTQEGIARQVRVSEDIIRDYVNALLNGGYLEVVSIQKINHICIKRTYRLVRDNGLEAPRLTKSGQEVVQGSGNEAMWGTLRRMFKTESVDYRQLAAFASTQKTAISVGTAKTYVLALAAAGYLECVQPAVKGAQPLPARYRLIPAMESGHRAPMIQRTKSVFDPNWNKVVWTEEKGIEDEQ
jgi:hypothetical protein